MFFSDRRQFHRIPMPCRVPEDDTGGGGGGDEGGDDKGKGKGKNKPDHTKDMADLKAQNAALMERLDKLEKRKAKVRDDDVDDEENDDDEGEDLKAKAKKSREASDKSKNDAKAIEAAVRFNMGAENWLKNNATILPKNIADIFAQAEKEKYDDPVQKDAAIKSGVIQAFFEVQSNLDLLTQGQKNLLDEYLKLTKTGKQEKARDVYDTIFEPSFEMLKRVKKAEALAKGHGSSTDSESAYMNKLISGSRKHYLGEKTS